MNTQKNSQTVTIVVSDPFGAKDKKIVVIGNPTHMVGLKDGMISVNCSDEHRDLSDHLDNLQARGLIQMVTEREVEIVRDLQLNPAYRSWLLLEEADSKGLIVYDREDSESCVSWTPTNKFEAIFESLWQTFTFKSEAASPEGQDIEEVYRFHPHVNLTLWEGVEFHNGKSDCANSRDFHHWIDQLPPELWREVSTERSKSVMDIVRELED